LKHDPLYENFRRTNQICRSARYAVAPSHAGRGEGEVKGECRRMKNEVLFGDLAPLWISLFDLLKMIRESARPRLICMVARPRIIL
jgi:hypothetical protein